MHEGGRVEKGVTLTGLTIANLSNAVKDMLSRSAKLSQFPDADAQYEVVRNFWDAVKKWIPEAWREPSSYIVFKGVGLYAITYLGVEIIDRCLLKGRFEVKDMLRYLKQIDDTSLLSSTNTLAYAGRAGAVSWQTT
jgi:hypothetical protein